MEVESSRNQFTFEPDEQEVIYVGDILSWGGDEAGAFKTGVMHFLFVLHSMNVEHPWREKFGEIEFGHG